MATKEEISAELTEKGIEHDPTDTKSNLIALLPSTEQDEANTETIGDIEVGDPRKLRPVTLPLVVKPANGGEWKNPQQAEYARALNAYAYKNPTKWAAKKNDTQVGAVVVKGLITKLREIGDDPSKFQLYSTIGNNLSFKDNRLGESATTAE